VTTFADLEHRVRTVASRLVGLGVGTGDCVALFTQTCREWIDVWLAAATIGALSVPINTAFRGDFLRHQMADSGATLMLTESALLPRLPYFAVPRYVEVIDALPKNGVGRVQKFTLRQAAPGERTWDREAAGYVVRR
jgi:acyl-coenzyme A synthetase/AMP-(fatty) acid ligase